MSKAVTANLDFGGVARSINHPDPVNPQDVATRAFVLATVGRTTSEINLASISGNQGTVNIASLECGGCVNVSPSADWSIEAFTAKPDGFWFILSANDANFRGTLFNEDGTATAVNRLRLTDEVEYSAAAIQAFIYYAESRWRVVVGGQSRNSVSVSGTQNALALGGADLVECTGDTTINGIAGGRRGRSVDIIAATSGLIRVNHLSGSAAASDQIALPSAASIIGDRIGLRLVHDGTLWRTSATAAPRATAGNSANTSQPTTGGGSNPTVSCGGQISIPANSMQVNDCYRFVAHWRFVHTAAALPLLEARLEISGTPQTFSITPVATAGTYHGVWDVIVCCRSIGAAGEVLITFRTHNSVGATDANKLGGAQLVAAMDTTIARTLELTTRTATAVVGNLLNLDNAFVQRIT